MLKKILINYLLINKVIVLNDLRFLFENFCGTQSEIDEFLLTLPSEFKTNGHDIRLACSIERQDVGVKAQYEIENFAKFVERRRLVRRIRFNWDYVNKVMCCKIGDDWTIKILSEYDNVILAHNDPSVLSVCLSGCKDLRDVESKALRRLGPITADDYYDPIANL